MATNREVLNDLQANAGDGLLSTQTFVIGVLALLDKLDEVQAAIESGKDPKPPK